MGTELQFVKKDTCYLRNSLSEVCLYSLSEVCLYFLSFSTKRTNAVVLTIASIPCLPVFCFPSRTWQSRGLAYSQQGAPRGSPYLPGSVPSPFPNWESLQRRWQSAERLSDLARPQGSELYRLIWLFADLRCTRGLQPTPVFLPGESHGQRSLAGYSPWGCKNWA